MVKSASQVHSQALICFSRCPTTSSNPPVLFQNIEFKPDEASTTFLHHSLSTLLHYSQNTQEPRSRNFPPNMFVTFCRIQIYAQLIETSAGINLLRLYRFFRPYTSCEWCKEIQTWEPQMLFGYYSKNSEVFSKATAASTSTTAPTEHQFTA